MKKLSVVMPAYNEATRIEKTLRDVHAYLSSQTYEWEVLVVNDGSTDTTGAVVSSLASQMPGIVLVDNTENHGKGWVVKQGMLDAVGDIRLFMDSDNSTNIREIEKFLPYFEKGAQLVIGSRRIAGANVAKDQNRVREFLGWCFRTIVHIIVPVGVTDTQCGFKAMTSRAAETIFPKQTIYRWAFDVEILSLARSAKFTISEVPITWVNDEASHVKLLGMINMLLEIIRIRINLWTGIYK